MFDENNVANPEKVEMCLPPKIQQKDWNSYVEKTYHYIERERITHYISTIHLGAAEYYNPKNSTSRCNPSTIGGNLDDVREGIEENVVEYEILPLQALINVEHLKLRALLQEALGMYFKRGSKFALFV